jgi:hypothetical protein
MEYRELTKLHAGSLVKSQDFSFNIGRIDATGPVAYIYDQDGQPNYLDDLEGVKITADFLLKWNFKQDNNQFTKKTKDYNVNYNTDNCTLIVKPNATSDCHNLLVCTDVEFIHEFWNLLDGINVDLDK